MRYLFIVALCLLFSCDPKPEVSNEVNGVILWTGDVAADGCDWVVRIDNVSYHPKNLPDQFKHDQMAVKVSYLKTFQKFSCGFAGPAGGGLTIINILSIHQ